VIPDVAIPAQAEKPDYASTRDDTAAERRRREIADENRCDEREGVRRDMETFACKSCSSPVPKVRVFCPQCGAFQGSPPSAGDQNFVQPQINYQEHLSKGSPRVFFGRAFSRRQVITSLAGIAIVAVIVLVLTAAHRPKKSRIPPVIRTPEAHSQTDKLNAHEALPHSAVDPSAGWSGSKDAAVAPSVKPRSEAEVRVTVEDVKVVQEQNRIDIQFASSRPIVPNVTRLSDPERLVIDVLNAVCEVPRRRIAVHSAKIKAVRASQFQIQPPVTRVVVDLVSPNSYHVSASGKKLVINID
jgi:hypothetical protein